MRRLLPYLLATALILPATAQEVPPAPGMPPAQFQAEASQSAPGTEPATGAQPSQGPQPASGPAALIADGIAFDSVGETITATGNVEVIYDGARLRAAAITYSGVTDTIRVQGPLTLIDETGAAILVADFAELDADLQTGVLQSARLVLDRQLQIAAARIERQDGRFTTAYQTVASSCEVCAENPTPLWEIRASRITHDAEARQIYFDDAQFRALGVPIAYLPRLRLPDPTLRRATGFLAPEFVANDQIGTGVRVPYFIVLNDQSDLTLTPFVTLANSQTLEVRYRHAFERGYLQIEGAMTRDQLGFDLPRAFVFVDGVFALPADFILTFDVEAVTDPAYLLTYDFSDRDRLDSEIAATRVRRDAFIRSGFVHYQTLREDEDERLLPTEVVFADYVRRLPAWGGIATLSGDILAFHRDSDADIVGRDVARASASVDWRGDWIGPAGLLLALQGRLDLDAFRVDGDSTLPASEFRATPTVAAELRWPLAAAGTGGATHLIEPVVQLAFAPESDARVPNEDSLVVELDEGNLFDLNRFAGDDVRETGLRTAFGLTYTRTDPDGWSLGVTAGRVLRADDDSGFPASSELGGAESDWLFGTHLTFGERLTLMHRTLFADDLAVSSNELALDYAGPQTDLGARVTWLAEDELEGRDATTAEWALTGAYDFDSPWATAFDVRYDLDDGGATRAGLAVTYENECVDVTFSVDRRFTDSTSLDPATDFGLTVALNGFGATRDGRDAGRACRR